METVSVEVAVDVVEFVGVPVLVEVPVLAGVPVPVEGCVAVVAMPPVAEEVALAVAATVRLIVPTEEDVGPASILVAVSGSPASGGLPTPTPALSVQAGPSALKKTTTPIDRALCVVVTVVPSSRRIDASGVPVGFGQNRVVTETESTFPAKAWRGCRDLVAPGRA